MVELPTPILLVPAPKDKGNALANPLIRKSPRFQTVEKLMGEAICTTPIDTHHYLPKRKLRKQYLDESDNGSLFPLIEEYPQDVFSRLLGQKIWEETLSKLATILVKTFWKKESC